MFCIFTLLHLQLFKIYFLLYSQNTIEALRSELDQKSQAVSDNQVNQSDIKELKTLKAEIRKLKSKVSKMSQVK